MFTNNFPPPVIIGGLGGSGTRLIARCLEELNFFIGHDLNQSKDNLWFTLLFKHLEILETSNLDFKDLLDLFIQRMLSNSPVTNKQKKLIDNLVNNDRAHSFEFLLDRAKSISNNHNEIEPGTQWGWKEPNSHIILDKLHNNIQDMKYIYVIRNGLDMAHSSNQNQQKLWGEKFIGKDFEMTPYYSLKYWCKAHERLLLNSKRIGNKFLLLNYDSFCKKPKPEISKLMNFLDLPTTPLIQQKIMTLINTPGSIGRYKTYGTKIFDPSDISYAQSLGFDTT